MGAALAASGHGDRWRDLTMFLEAQQREGVFPGAALIVSRRGRVAFQRYAGTYCSLRRRDAPLDAGVLHPLYSFSKLVSATVVAMAVDDGLVKYDAPVRTYIPEFTGGGKDQITLRHLLTHSAGIPNAPIRGARTEEEWRDSLAAVCAAPTEWEAGSRTAYHALTGLFVAAEAVRRVCGGQSWARLCRERLFEPIGAQTLTFAVPPDNLPVAITPQPPELPKTHRDAFGFAGHPAGGCIGTAEDALKVLQLHLNGGRWGRRRLISARTLAEMHRVQYAREREQARAEGRAPVHETWGLGPLLRGPGPKEGGHDWFGFGDQTSPGIFGHAGIDTVIGVADPATGAALVFITTDSPKPPEKTVPLRNGVTNRVFAALS